MAPRWKGKDAKAKKDAEAEALKEPMSKIVSQLQSSLVQKNACGLLCDNSVRIAVGAEQVDLLDQACFGRPVATVDKDTQWFQLSLEEAFYLCYSLKCLRISGGNTSPQSDEELWHYMKSNRETFPCFYKAYSHLRMKNWVVRSGAQYGVDFVVYRHHPARVHSEYGVLVLSDEDNKYVNGRLRVWSDVHCTTRLLGSVAKILLILYINKNGNGDESPSCLAKFTVEERTITRWSPEQCREGLKDEARTNTDNRTGLCGFFVFFLNITQEEKKNYTKTSTEQGMETPATSPNNDKGGGGLASSRKPKSYERLQFANHTTYLFSSLKL